MPRIASETCKMECVLIVLQFLTFYQQPVSISLNESVDIFTLVFDKTNFGALIKSASDWSLLDRDLVIGRKGAFTLFYNKSELIKLSTINWVLRINCDSLMILWDWLVLSCRSPWDGFCVWVFATRTSSSDSSDPSIFDIVLTRKSLSCPCPCSVTWFLDCKIA